MIHRLIIAALFLSLSQVSFARDFEGSYAVYGAGADSCGKYLSSMTQGGRQQDYFIDYLIGYLSAFNVIMPNTHNILGESGFDAAQLWLQRHCKRYPKELFITSVIKLTEVLYPMRNQSGLKVPPQAAPSSKASK